MSLEEALLHMLIETMTSNTRVKLLYYNTCSELLVLTNPLINLNNQSNTETNKR